MSSEREQAMLRFERALWSRGVRHVAGIDEAGRGPLAGPLVAAAVVAEEGFFIPEVNDSKQLTARLRDSLYEEIMAGGCSIGIGIVDHLTIDRVNILQATFKAMRLAVNALGVRPDHLLIDGNRFLDGDDADGLHLPFTTIVRGDAQSFSIAAASIVAKVTRDRLMIDYERQFPGYGFAQHKGYGTKQHREAIARLGFSPIHRRSFNVKTQREIPL